MHEWKIKRQVYAVGISRDRRYSHPVEGKGTAFPMKPSTEEKALMRAGDTPPPIFSS
jgi:hypothetical protein